MPEGEPLSIWVYGLGLLLLILSALVITSNLKIAFGVAFAFIALLFLSKLDNHDNSKSN